MDEPTAGSSTENAFSIFNAIKQQQPEITILMATHLADFEAVVDKIERL